jgi:hypothetical protein
VVQTFLGKLLLAIAIWKIAPHFRSQSGIGNERRLLPFVKLMINLWNSKKIPRKDGNLETSPKSSLIPLFQRGGSVADRVFSGEDFKECDIKNVA